MELIKQSAEMITEKHPLKRIEYCARVCYASRDRITDTSYMHFVKQLIKMGHTSVLEHARVSFPHELAPKRYIDQYDNDFSHIYGFESRINYPGAFLLTMNARDFLALEGDFNVLDSPEYNANDYYTFKLTTDRGTANQLVRHRVFSFSQESTRYVNYGNIKFILPDIQNEPLKQIFVDSLKGVEELYRLMVKSKEGLDTAGRLLPLCTATELCMTGTKDQWDTLIKERTAKGVHPMTKELMLLVQKQIEENKENENR